MSEEFKCGLLYLSLHNLLKKKVGIDKTISRKDFYTILGKHFLIPKNIRVTIIKEMEQKQLIKQDGRETIKVLECEFDLERDANKFYQWVGIF